MCLRMFEEKTFTARPQDIYQPRRRIPDGQNSPRARQPCMARSRCHLRMETMGIAKTPAVPLASVQGVLASANLSHYYYSSARHSAPVAERLAPGPPSSEACGVRDSAVEGAPTTVNPKRNSKRPR